MFLGAAKGLTTAIEKKSDFELVLFILDPPATSAVWKGAEGCCYCAHALRALTSPTPNEHEQKLELELLDKSYGSREEHDR